MARGVARPFVMVGQTNSCNWQWCCKLYFVLFILVSHGQTAYFSFDMGAEKNKLAYYRYMFCAENRQILAIVDWPLIGVDRLQRCSARMTYKVVLKFVATYHSSVFEWCQHQSVANQQSQNLAILCTKHVTVVRQTLIFLCPHIKRKISGLATRDYVHMCIY